MKGIPGSGKKTGKWCGRKLCKVSIQNDTSISTCRQYGCSSLKADYRLMEVGR